MVGNKLVGKLRPVLKIDRMKPIRTVLFWAHLAAGTVAGVVILIMSVTGVALTYEKLMPDDRIVQWVIASAR